MRRPSIFLVVVALVAGAVSCVYPSPLAPEYNLTISSTEKGR